jgi:hypothetical protein
LAALAEEDWLLQRPIRLGQGALLGDPGDILASLGLRHRDDSPATSVPWWSAQVPGLVPEQPAQPAQIERFVEAGDPMNWWAATPHQGPSDRVANPNMNKAEDDLDAPLIDFGSRSARPQAAATTLTSFGEPA